MVCSNFVTSITKSQSSFEAKLPIATSRETKKNKDPAANKTLQCFLALLLHMSEVVWGEAPSLQRPLLVVAFQGLFDAGECATGAIDWIINHHKARRIAHIDPEEFYDFQEVRPEVYINEEGDRLVRWPSLDVHVIENNLSHDLVLLQGIEPRMRWRTFCESVVEIATDTNCEMVVTLGAMAAGVPHSRPSEVKGSAANPELARRLGLDRPSYQGPTGIIGTLHDALDRASLPVVSLRVGIPHYVAGPPNPKGTRALLQEFEHVTGVLTGYNDLDVSSLEWEERVADAVSQDPEIMDYVRQLEEEVERASETDLPSGDDLAAEFQKFLREQRDE
ncbi:MAG TPA: carboxylate--amine ligase [Acidimicrobiaceae bacterium]|nr:carboxylate--amine ligase [Acidimicrobiaceae bacterium]